MTGFEHIDMADPSGQTLFDGNRRSRTDRLFHFGVYLTDPTLSSLRSPTVYSSQGLPTLFFLDIFRFFDRVRADFGRCVLLAFPRWTCDAVRMCIKALSREPIWQEMPAGFHLADVEVRLVEPTERLLWDDLMDTHHYLGFRRFAGRGLRYAATWQGRWLALAGWQGVGGVLDPQCLRGTAV